MGVEYVLQTDHLQKHFGSVRAVEDVSLAVRRAEVFGFLGPNGAGKTTTISMILGLTHPTMGTVNVLGKPVTPQQSRVLQHIGALVGSPALILPFSARRNLQIMSYLRPDLPSQRINEVLEWVGLRDAAHRRVQDFSTGMKQRLGLAMTLLNRPDLLILDEPTNGMDPAGIHEVRLLLRSLVEQGMTVFLSSHLLHEMELVCDRVAIIQHGHIIAQGAVTELLGRAQEIVRVRTDNPDQTMQALSSIPDAYAIHLDAPYVEVQGVSSEVVLYHLVSEGLTPKGVTVSHLDLEKVFLDLTRDQA